MGRPVGGGDAGTLLLLLLMMMMMTMTTTMLLLLLLTAPQECRYRPRLSHASQIRPSCRAPQAARPPALRRLRRRR